MVEAITLGELLIDFVSTQSEVSLVEAPAFKKSPGGAPANVAVGLKKLGVPSGFMGKVGEDPFGHFLAQTLEKQGVDISTLCFSMLARTSLAFVSLTASGERDFMFYRHPGADMLYTPDEVDDEYIRQSKLFHFGSISLISEPSRSATLHALEIAHEAGLTITYDPNLRISLWRDAQTAKAGIMEGWPKAQVIKISQDELEFLSQEDDLETAARSLWHDGLQLLVITLGSSGCVYVTENDIEMVEGFSVQTVDTTGAGDAFVAGLIKGIHDTEQVWEDEDKLREICRYANAVGAITTTQRGAIPALPTAKRVEKFLNHHS
jgi:fructokinase